MENEITRVEPVSPLATAAQLVQQADGKIDVAQLRELLELQERYDANEAKKAYVVAMAAFKADPPKIIKDMHVGYKQTSYNHASLANVTSCINTALSGHGLTGSWVTSQDNGSVKVTCKITHVLGHSEITCLSAAPDTTGSKNPIQAIGSTVTYLQRYTILALTGLATYEQDDDGVGSHDEPVLIPPPNEKEQVVIGLICDGYPVPDGMRVDTKKVANLFWAVNGAYPKDKKRVDKAIEWVVETGRPVCVPDNRSTFEKDYDIPEDEHSQPDPVELRYFCKGCDREFDEAIKGKCPHCISDKLIDRQAK